ncbi:MAG TPA: SLC13 family permease [Gammaproteobacteria bacterium]|nr:SLC13 family permease [Gammaproteobacteria bacterium]
MTVDAWIAVAVTLGCLGMLALTRIAADLIMIAGLTVLMALGVLAPADALGGFANQGVLTIAALYVVAAGLRETGAVNVLIRYVFGRPSSVTVAQLRMMLPVTFLSAFMNNTPVVATFLPAVQDWAKRQRISVSKLMIPLSYAAILGGTCTLIGTSTNLVVDGLLISRAHLPGFGFFELTTLGLPYAIVGIGYVLLLGRWRLPERVAAMENLQDPREYTVEMLVEPGSPLAGMTIQQAGLRQLPGLFLIEIDRDGHVVPAAGPNEQLQDGDRLVFAGITDSIVDLQRIKGLTPATDQVFKLQSPRPARTLIEAVIAAHSPMAGQTVREGAFRSRYNAVVIAVARDGQRIRRKIGDIKLHAGDTLLLETTPDFIDRHGRSRDFLLLRPIEGSVFPRHERSWLAWLILIGLVVTASVGVLNLVTAAFLAAGAMLLTGCCSVSVARRSIELEVLLVIAASFGIGRALQTSGAAGAFASSLLAMAGHRPWVLLAVIYFLTMALTETVTNNAAAVIMFPLALATTSALGLDFRPFAVAIAFAASASFATPIGYQTNLMVYGPGGYRFTDYLRFGLPLNLLLAAVALGLIPVIWPLA